LTFDWRELQRLGISESIAPSSSTLLFREPSPWEPYRWRIVLALAALVLQTGLIAGLYYEDRRRKTAEDNAHLLAAELEQSNRFATAGELTASIAHEVRQPLTSIVVAAEASLNWLGNEVPDLDEVRSSLRNIVKEGHRVDAVVRNMVAMFRHQSSERVSVDINSLIDDVLMLAGRKIQASNIRVQTEYAEKPIVFGNPVQLQQMLMNLVVNAIQAMNEHVDRGKVLRLRTETTSFPGHASIIVQDTGPGIGAEHVVHIFKPFFSTKSGGMGLGLAICKSIVDAHGGTLTVATADKGGTVFKILLPLDKGERS
jgi:signal transduction histidine kinase